MRQNGASPATTISKRVTIVIEKLFSEFDAHDEEILRHALASFLRIPVDSIGIIGTREGSIQVLVELPVDAMHRLLEAFKKNDQRLKDHLSIFPLKDILVESDWGRNTEPLSAADRVTEASSVLGISVEAEARRAYEERFARIFEGSYPMVHLFFTRRGFAVEAARDLTQETFLRLYSRGSSKFEDDLDSLIFEAELDLLIFELARQVHLEHRFAHKVQVRIKDALEKLANLMSRALAWRFREGTEEQALRKLLDAARAKLFVSRLMERKLLRPSNGPGHREP